MREARDLYYCGFKKKELNSKCRFLCLYGLLALRTYKVLQCHVFN